MPRPPLALPLVGALALGGCVMHEAAVRVPPSTGTGAGERGEAWLGGQRQTLPADPPAQRTERGQKPIDLPVTVYLARRGGGEGMLRWEGSVRTPLPWWDTFPIDIASDFWPQEVVARAEAVAEPRAVARRDPAELAAEARAHGYAAASR